MEKKIKPALDDEDAAADVRGTWRRLDWTLNVGACAERRRNYGSRGRDTV